MTERGIGDNGGPDLDGRRPTIRTKWAKALFADPDTPAYVMAIAWAIHWFSKPDGTGSALSNEQLKIICGISEPTATRGKAWLRDHGYVKLTIGKGIEKTKFAMSLPDHGVIREMTRDNHAEGPQTEGPQTDDPGNPCDDPRVIREMTNNQYIDSGKNPYPARTRARTTSKSFWTQTLNGATDEDVRFEDGKLDLMNGMKLEWVKQLGSEETLSLALKEIAPRMQPCSQTPLRVQIESQLAGIARKKRDQDERYANAAKNKTVPGQTPTKTPSANSNPDWWIEKIGMKR